MTQPFSIMMNERSHLAISGDLNFQTVPILWEQSLPLLEKSPELHFDLEKITFSNSAGLALLVEWMKYAQKMQKKIEFHHIPSQLGAIIDATGVNIPLT